MKLTNESKDLINFFINNGNNIPYIKISEKCKPIINLLFSDILTYYKSIQYQKKVNRIFSDVVVKYLETVKQIPKPKTFNSNSFTREVINHIDSHSFIEISYTFSLYQRNIKVYFILEDQPSDLGLNKFNRYVETIAIWISILIKYSSKKCSESLTVFIYFTKLKKHLPQSNYYTLNQNNVNTAFTYSCPKDTEIVIYRSEEWFKVFIHETFHSFGLDFSDEINITKKCNEEILKLFPVKSEVSSYEAYTEFFAEIMNAAFSSFYMNKHKTDFHSFLSIFDVLINIERGYSFFQLVKILNFMGLRYSDLYSSSNKSIMLRETMYRENTNVLSYYIIKTVLLNNYCDFLSWCNKNNDSLLQFKKTMNNCENFTKFIKENYKSKSMIKGIKDSEILLNNIYSEVMNKKNIHPNNLISNLRMTICELG